MRTSTQVQDISLIDRLSVGQPVKLYLPTDSGQIAAYQTGTFNGVVNDPKHGKYIEIKDARIYDKDGKLQLDMQVIRQVPKNVTGFERISGPIEPV